jgi:hypothetical protein
MMRLMPVAAVAAVVFELGTAGAAMPTSPEAPAAEMTILAARKELGAGVIPENCTIDPFKKVYVCCTRQGDSEPVCTEHPLDTDWPVQQQRPQKLKQLKPVQTQPLLLQQAP